MARRKDHPPSQLKEMIREAAANIIKDKGLRKLTVRSVAEAIGYAPGTIYNFYKDMDALVTDVNLLTLGRLEAFCRAETSLARSDFSKVRALAHAYVDFAHDNLPLWEAIFMRLPTDPEGPLMAAAVPEKNKQQILSLFAMIEDILKECMGLSAVKAKKSARLLWACLHGIAVLTLDGRLHLVGIDEPDKIIDDLLEKYFWRERHAG